MSRFSDIEKLFIPEGTVRGGTLFLDANSALKLITKAKQKNVKVLGIDTFEISEESPKPLLGHILDLSNNNQQSKSCWEIAANFVEQRVDKEFYFEIVLEE